MSLFDTIDLTPVSSSASPSPPPTPPAAALDDEEYEAEVAAEEAAVEASLNAGMTTVVVPPTPPPAMITLPTPPPATTPTPPPATITPPSAPSAPSAPAPSATIPVSEWLPKCALGDKLSVGLCAIGEEYMVDAEDGHSPYRMKFVEVSAGEFKFRDATGAKVALDVKDYVWKLPSTAAPTPPEPSDPRAVKPPDAPKTKWVDEQAPLTDKAIAEITDPKLRELAIEHKRMAEAEQGKKDAAEAAANPQAATRGGNCPGSGQVVLFSTQPSVVDGKVVCPICGMVKPIPKEVKKATPRPTEMPFPGHRRPKVTAVTETAATAAAATAVAKTTATAAATETTTLTPPPVVETTPTPPAVEVLPTPPPMAETAPTPPPVVATSAPTPPVTTTPVAMLDRGDIVILAGFFKAQVAAIPRMALSAQAIDLFKRLTFID